MDERYREWERLIGQQAQLVEQLTRSPNELELLIRFTHLRQQMSKIEDGLSLSAILFARRC
jgi:hypothetical protein